MYLHSVFSHSKILLKTDGDFRLWLGYSPFASVVVAVLRLEGVIF